MEPKHILIVVTGGIAAYACKNCLSPGRLSIGISTNQAIIGLTGTGTTLVFCRCRTIY